MATIPDYPSNSLNSKKDTDIQTKPMNQKPPHPGKMVQGRVKTKDPSTARRLRDIFVPEDVKSVKDYIIFDVLVPKARDAFFDTLNGTIDTFRYGVGNAPDRKKSPSVSYRDYSSFSQETRRGAGYISGSPVQTRRPHFAFEDVYMEDQSDANIVLEQLGDLIEVAGEISVGDLNELIGIQGEYTDNNYGWKSIAQARVIRKADGWQVKMGPAILLRR